MDDARKDWAATWKFMLDEGGASKFAMMLEEYSNYANIKTILAPHDDVYDENPDLINNYLSEIPVFPVRVPYYTSISGIQLGKDYQDFLTTVQAVNGKQTSSRTYVFIIKRNIVTVEQQKKIEYNRLRKNVNSIGQFKDVSYDVFIMMTRNGLKGSSLINFCNSNLEIKQKFCAATATKNPFRQLLREHYGIDAGNVDAYALYEELSNRIILDRIDVTYGDIYGYVRIDSAELKSRGIEIPLLQSGKSNPFLISANGKIYDTRIYYYSDNKDAKDIREVTLFGDRNRTIVKLPTSMDTTSAPITFAGFYYVLKYNGDVLRYKLKSDQSGIYYLPAEEAKLVATRISYLAFKDILIIMLSSTGELTIIDRVLNTGDAEFPDSKLIVKDVSRVITSDVGKIITQKSNGQFEVIEIVNVDYYKTNYPDGNVKLQTSALENVSSGNGIYDKKFQSDPIVTMNFSDIANVNGMKARAYFAITKSGDFYFIIGNLVRKVWLVNAIMTATKTPLDNKIFNANIKVKQNAQFSVIPKQTMNIDPIYGFILSGLDVILTGQTGEKRNILADNIYLTAGMKEMQIIGRLSYINGYPLMDNPKVVGIIDI